ncbi:MAG: hypothetical protein JO284_11720 [Planctomycetaceae bacterium]|nr:hypothetical protein [Planctomycetaceae bacterium]MBV8315324.1 hypothetical protein [Planctomycetaceae bacterium]MBV8557018.1 hypothetical protein [Planctomycetaceae bacterium]
MRFTISLFRNIEGLPPERIRHDLKRCFLHSSSLKTGRLIQDMEFGQFAV